MVFDQLLNRNELRPLRDGYLIAARGRAHRFAKQLGIAVRAGIGMRGGQGVEAICNRRTTIRASSAESVLMYGANGHQATLVDRGMMS